MSTLKKMPASQKGILILALIAVSAYVVTTHSSFAQSTGNQGTCNNY
ncbi:MAG: hypothetical protein WAN50_02720 [Minisyncoccia bacterium]